MAKKINEEGTVDYISELPNEILCHILYFLPVTDAFAFKLLCRRFRRIQVPLSNLYFNKQTIFGTKYKNKNKKVKLNSQFAEKVDSFLKLFKGPYLNAFVVHFRLDHELAPVIDNWIRLAISMEAESIDLNFFSVDFFRKTSSRILYKFPFHFLPKPKSFPRLKHLKLSNCSLDFCPPTLNCLKTIELESIRLDQTSLDGLFSSCLDLEWLTIDHCKIPRMLHVCSGNLRGLRIIDCYELQIIIEFNATQLHTFEFRGSSLENLIFLVVPPLERVEFGFSYPCNVERFYSLLRQILPELQTLSLSCYIFNSIPATIPEFSCLKQLEFFQSEYREFNFLSITNLLDVCPMLQKLHVDVPRMACRAKMFKNEKVVLNSETAKYLNLEEIEISGFRGTSKEMKFVKYLLNNAINLKHITLIYSRWKSFYSNWVNVDDSRFLVAMSEKKHFFHDSLRKEMTSHEAALILC